MGGAERRLHSIAPRPLGPGCWEPQRRLAPAAHARLGAAWRFTDDENDEDDGEDDGDIEMPDEVNEDDDGGDCDIVDDPTGGEEPEDGEPGAPCGTPGDGRILDCEGNCADGELLWRWAEDEFCDDGTFTYVLTCEYFADDGGACDDESESGSP